MILKHTFFINNTEYDCYVLGYEIPSGCIYEFGNQKRFLNSLELFIVNNDVVSILSNVFTMINVNGDDIKNYILNNKLNRYKKIYVKFDKIVKYDYLNNTKIENINNNDVLTINNDVVYLHNIRNKANISIIYDDNNDNVITDNFLGVDYDSSDNN